MNTSVGAVDRLTDQAQDFKQSITELVKKVASVGKEASTADNKLDRYTTEVSGLKKRIVELGAKK